MKGRFIITIGYLCPFPGAGWSRISYFAQYFRQQGYCCDILSSFSPMTVGETKIRDQSDLRIYNIMPSIMVDNAFFWFFNNLVSFIFAFPFFVAKRPQMVVVSIPPANQLISIYLLAKCSGAKVVVDYRDEFEEYMLLKSKSTFNRFLKSFYSKLYQGCHLVLPVSTNVLERLAERGVKNTHVTFDGVDTEVFKPFDKEKERLELKIAKDQFVIVFVGYVYDAYRLDVVVQALSELKKQNPENEGKYLLLIIGGGEVETLMTYARSLGVTSMIKYIGVIKDSRVLAQTMSAADLGIIPYDDNPLWNRTHPTKMFEYSACGLPIISTVSEKSLLAQYIKTYSLGIVVPPVDSMLLAQGIKEMKESRENYVPNLLSFAKEFDKRKIMENLFEKVLSK